MYKEIETIIYRYAFGQTMYDQDNALSVCRECYEKAWLPKDVKHKRKCEVGKILKKLEKNSGEKT